jgi:hypothetical protein
MNSKFRTVAMFVGLLQVSSWFNRRRCQYPDCTASNGRINSQLIGSGRGLNSGTTPALYEGLSKSMKNVIGDSGRVSNLAYPVYNQKRHR